MSGPTYAPPPGLAGVRWRAFGIGVLASGVAVAIGAGDPTRFYPAYLLAYHCWLGIGLGSLALLMVQHLTGGAWGMMTRRIFEAGAGTLPLMAVMFVPLAFGLGYLYPWTDTATVMADPVLRQKMTYLSPPFFVARTAFYFAAWIALAWLLARWSRAQDRTGDPRYAASMRKLSGGGLVLWCLTLTLAAVDWLMSLEPHWFSTIFGLIVVGGQGLSALAFAIIVLSRLAAREPLAGVVKPVHFHDLGNLLLAFVVLWAYLAFSQLLIIWSGNLAEEIPWYLHRIQGSWTAVAVAIAVFYFAVPFLLLLSRQRKRRARAIAAVAGAILVARLVDLIFLIGPEFSPAGFRVNAVDAAAVVGIGGLWIAMFAWQLGRRPLLPVGDPDLQDGISPAHG